MPEPPLDPSSSRSAAPEARASGEQTDSEERLSEAALRMKRFRAALRAVDALEPVPAPSSWSAWKEEYSRLKTAFRGPDPLIAEAPEPGEGD